MKYFDFTPYNVSKPVTDTNIKMFQWNSVITQLAIGIEWNKTEYNVIDYIPFNAYLINRCDSSAWLKYAKDNGIVNTVYILYGRDYIYVGKAENADRIRDHVKNSDKDAFDYQLIFCANKNSASLRIYNWDKLLMESIESILINVLRESLYCDNQISGLTSEKLTSHLDSKDKETFVHTISDMMIEAFKDITTFDYLLPEKKDIKSDIIFETNNVMAGPVKNQVYNSGNTVFAINVTKYFKNSEGKNDKARPYSFNDTAEIIPSAAVNADGSPESFLIKAGGKFHGTTTMATGESEKKSRQEYIDILIANKILSKTDTNEGEVYEFLKNVISTEITGLFEKKNKIMSLNRLCSVMGIYIDVWEPDKHYYMTVDGHHISEYYHYHKN